MGCSEPAPSAWNSSRSCRTRGSPAPPDTSVYSGWWRDSAPKYSTRPCSSSSPSGRDWWLSWWKLARTNNNNNRTRWCLRISWWWSPPCRNLLLTVLKKLQCRDSDVQLLYTVRLLTPPFSQRALIGPCEDQGHSHWLFSPCGMAGKNEEIRLGYLKKGLSVSEFPLSVSFYLKSRAKVKERKVVGQYLGEIEWLFSNYKPNVCQFIKFYKINHPKDRFRKTFYY